MHVYILRCSDQSYYVGSTSNLMPRLDEHQSGNGAVHTMKRLPVELVYYEAIDSSDKLRKREQEIKKLSRANKEKLIDSVSWSRDWALATYAYITNTEGYVLLMHHPVKDVYMLPGGGVELGESIVDALKREVHEEITCKIIPGSIKLIDQKIAKQQVIYVLEAKIAAKEEFIPNLECDHYQYFPLDNLPENIAESHKKRLNAINSNSNQLMITP